MSRRPGGRPWQVRAKEAWWKAVESQGEAGRKAVEGSSEGGLVEGRGRSGGGWAEGRGRSGGGWVEGGGRFEPPGCPQLLEHIAVTAKLSPPACTRCAGAGHGRRRACTRLIVGLIARDGHVHAFGSVSVARHSGGAARSVLGAAAALARAAARRARLVASPPPALLCAAGLAARPRVETLRLAGVRVRRRRRRRGDAPWKGEEDEEARA